MATAQTGPVGTWSIGSLRTGHAARRRGICGRRVARACLLPDSLKVIVTTDLYAQYWGGGGSVRLGEHLLARWRLGWLVRGLLSWNRVGWISFAQVISKNVHRL
ncbi:unnamed protein product [Protopolystoma xenopodis]|uniref:Uncharacterized protein n=1 Tax=Protopolystoma xenopodis TaxID=117903 RepID=A0A3S5FCQ8_9PLAT|nr:unnamed protein product [Protopolystoma xenopodis]